MQRAPTRYSLKYTITSGNTHSNEYFDECVLSFMQMNWNDYIYQTHQDGFLIFKHKEDNGTPKYAYRGEHEMVKGETVTAETLTDIKILIQEFLAYHFSNGIATGYRRTGYPPPKRFTKT